jgi:hypothetical protein
MFANRNNGQVRELDPDRAPVNRRGWALSIGKNQDRFLPPIKVLALPAKVGLSRKGKYTAQGFQVSTTSKIIGEETVTVPAGSFKTIRVEVTPEPGLLTTTTW